MTLGITLEEVNHPNNLFCYFMPFSFDSATQMAFIIVAGICLCLYFLFLCFMVFQVFRNISGKQSSLPAMSKARRLHYEVVTPCCMEPLFLKVFSPEGSTGTFTVTAGLSWEV